VLESAKHVMLGVSSVNKYLLSLSGGKIIHMACAIPEPVGRVFVVKLSVGQRPVVSMHPEQYPTLHSVVSSYVCDHAVSPGISVNADLSTTLKC